MKKKEQVKRYAVTWAEYNHNDIVWVDLDDGRECIYCIREIF